MNHLLIRNAHLNDDDSLQDIKIEDGYISKVAPQIENTNVEEIDANGRVVIPSLIESHIHPDKAFLEERKPNVSGTLDEAMKNTGALKSQYTYDDVRERAERVIKWAVKNGTTIMRAHPDVDPIEKTLGVEVLLDLKEKYQDVLDMQIVAFPQEAIFKTEGVLELMEKSINMGADVVGGCPYSEETMEDAERHLQAIFDLSEKYNLPVDIHADFSDDTLDPRYATVGRICEITKERGMQGKVSIGHVTSLGSLDIEEASPLFEKIANAGVSILPLPQTDLFMNGREDRKNVRRGMAPVQVMLDHGINVAYSSNNIRNAFTPFGNADMLTVGYLLAESQHMGSMNQRSKVVDMATYDAAKSLGILDSYGLEAGKKADLVIFNSVKKCDLINDLPLAQYVIKRGQVIVKNELETKVADVLS